MDSEGVIKVAWRNPSVFLLSFLCPTSPLLSLLLYFSPLILSTAALCAIALIDIVPHETESEPVEQIVAVWLQWLMGVDRRSDSVCSDNNIPSTSQAFDSPPPAADQDIMPKDRISLEYVGGSCDEESVLESDSEEEYEEESSTEELEVCERMIKTQGALDLITFELHKIVMAAQNFMSTLRKWLPVISSIMATFERKQTEENLTGVHVYGVLLKFQNISVRLHEELEQHILKFPEDYKQKAALGRQLTTCVESCKLQCQREQSDISFESFSGLREKYDAEDSSLWMQDFSSSDEEKASECSSDPDSSSLVDLEKTSTARNSTNYSDQSLKEEPASQKIMEPAGIL